MPNILFIINSLEGGGAERVFSTIVQNLLPRFDNVKIHVALLDDRVTRYKLPEKVATHILNADGAMLPSIRGVRKLVRELKPDYALSFLARSNCASILATRGAKTRCIISERVHPSSHYPQSLSGKVNRWLMKTLYPMADVVIAVSKGVETDLRDNYGVQQNRLVTINNPYDHDGIAKKGLAEPDFVLPDSYFVSIGRLVENKGFDMLIKAYAKAKCLQKLIILGEGPKRDELEALIQQLGLQDKVMMPGFADNPYSIVSRSDGYICASKAEGFPNAIVEAMILEKPIISTDCHSGPAEILAETDKANPSDIVQALHGILVPESNEAALSRAIALLANDEKLRLDYGHKARQRSKAYTLESIVEQYWHVLAPFITAAPQSALHREKVAS
jgi:glycosyltransferase involved in cell wall biosynthesis